MVIVQEWTSVSPLFGNVFLLCKNLTFLILKIVLFISAQFGTQWSPMIVGELVASVSMVATIPAVIVTTQDIFCHINGKTV